MSGRDRVILIAGASTGIGAAGARLLATEGWRLVLAARSLDRLEALAHEFGGRDRALAVACDVTAWRDQEFAINAALEHFGQIDAVWANAGLHCEIGFLADTVENWRDLVLTNVYGTALTIRAAIPPLSDARGHLLLTGSVGGRRVSSGSLYSATKHAVHAMAEAARLELDGTGVRVTVIAPGIVETGFWKTLSLREPLRDVDVARAVHFALDQPPHVNVNEIILRPTEQDN
jgi:NADP-dependent 3-hydroxy acid dehydrogenase YdfG